jgi:hypothetical protein
MTVRMTMSAKSTDRGINRTRIRLTMAGIFGSQVTIALLQVLDAATMKSLIGSARRRGRARSGRLGLGISG